MSEHVSATRDGAIATVVLDRPEKLNALTKTMWQALGAAVDALSADDSLRCVIVPGAPREPGTSKVKTRVPCSRSQISAHLM